MKATTILTTAKQFLGQPYILGVIVPKDKSNYKGAFDCAEFVAFINFQCFGILYGCDTNKVERAAKADAYTGYFDRDAKKLGKIITVEEAIRTPGAMLLRIATGSSIGHIVFSQGNGRTIEAHSTKYGVIESTTNNRRFDYGILLNGVEYLSNKALIESKAPAVVYRLKTPNMKAPFVGEIQRILGLTVDHIYGVKTQAAVVKFQRSRGLVADGEVMPNGETARALGIK